METQLNQTWLSFNGAFRDVATDMPRNFSPRAPDKPTHDELRDLYLSKRPNVCYGLGDWREYESGVWLKISSDSVKKEISEIVDRAKMLGVRPASHVLSSVYELARVKVAVPDERWDADPNLLPLKNGVLRISSRELLPHKPENYLTSALSFDFDETATCPTWTQALSRLDDDVVSFLQEYAGYALTTDCRYEIALWLYGARGSGKSTVILGLETMLGSRAGILGLADIERSSFALSNLPGKTLVTASEQPNTFIKSAHILNALISGEPITVERKYHDAYTYAPRCKLVWSMNELPRVSDASSGLFRRVKVLRFPDLPENERDPRVKENISKEGAGILLWALQGLERLSKRGKFIVPESVKTASEDFERQNDVAKLFVEEKCVVSAGYQTKSSVLYDCYKAWCLSNGHQAMSSTRLAEDWQRLGFVRTRSNGTFWQGVGLVS